MLNNNMLTFCALCGFKDTILMSSYSTLNYLDHNRRRRSRESGNADD